MSAAARIVLRPIGNPLPLGFLALAGGTLMVSGLQLGWLEPALGQDVALILIGFVFPLQLLAAVFGFLGRDVVAGTGMGILGGPGSRSAWSRSRARPARRTTRSASSS